MQDSKGNELTDRLKKPLSHMGMAVVVFAVAMLALVVFHQITINDFILAVIGGMVIQSIALILLVRRAKERLRKD
ncbi:hypothetical protein LDB30_06470 [Acidithiobacillus ferrooxidans]|jgi:preprotein translocase subunit SecF|nr:hypothetical protein [Ferrovum sp.]UBU63634.1 hypothetical protein LDB30_06470 [Acidithiobacillus ferrooxidans]